MAEEEAAREAAQAEAEANRVTIVGNLFNWVDHRSPTDSLRPGAAERQISFTDRWVLYEDGLASTPIDVSAVRDNAESLYGRGVRVRGVMEGDMLIAESIVAAPRADEISVEGRIVYEGTAVGPGGETPSTVKLITETSAGRREIPLESRPEGLLGRRVVAAGRPYLTRPTPTIGIQEILFEVTSIEAAEPTPGEIVSHLQNVVLTRPNGNYTLIDLDTVTMYPVEVDLVEQEARRLVEYGQLFASVAVERESDGSLVYHLSSIGPHEVDGGLATAYLNGDLHGTILPVENRTPNADGYIDGDILLVNGARVGIPLESSYISRLEGHPVQINMEWYLGASEPNAVEVMGGVAFSSSVWPEFPVLMRPWRYAHHGWVVPVGDDRFGLVLRTGEGIEIDLSARTTMLSGMEAAVEELTTMAELGGFVQLFGQLPEEGRDDTNSLLAFAVTFVPGVGDLRLQGQVVQSDESESGLGLSIGRGMDRITVPLTDLSAGERAGLSTDSWVTVFGTPFIHKRQELGNAYIVGLEVDRVW